MKKKSEEIKYWVVSDTHFGHEKIKEYCGRPDGFEEIVFENLKKIPEDCYLIHLGDIAFGNTVEHHEKYIAPLKCKKILVRGNHDKKSRDWYLTHGWDAVFLSGELRVVTDNGKMVIFSHDKISPEKGLEYSYNVFGHYHNKWPILNEKQILFSLESEGYKAVLLNELIDIKNKENESR